MAVICEDCGGRNPSIPVYSQGKPEAANENCQRCDQGNQILYPPVSGDKSTEILAGFSIEVQDLSDANTDRFEVAYSRYTSPLVSQSIIVRISSSPRSIPLLKGTEIDEVESNWSYNSESEPAITTQSLTLVTGAGDSDPANPTLIKTDRDYTYSGVSITEDASISILGSDGIESDSDVDLITFGNYLAIDVVDPSLLFQSPAGIQAVFDALATKVIRTTQSGYSFDAFGSASEYMLIMYPASWGESVFTKNSFSGGYQRIRLVDRGGSMLFTVNLEVGDVEQDIIVSNNNPDGAFQEPYIVYQSEYTARTGESPTVITVDQ